MLRLSLVVLLVLCASSCQSAGLGEEWHVLFDGESTAGWRGMNRADAPAGWQVEEGALAFVPDVEGGDLLTEDTYRDFELELEWKISEGGNSGIFFRVAEDGHDWVWQSGPEMQVLDDARHHDGQSPLTSAGANYALHAAPAGVVRPAGEWNSVRLVVRGAQVEHWLNGTRVVSYELWSPAWEELVAASKFAAMPGYGREKEGHIALQDHGDRVWYRNVRVRRL